jgi:CRISPR-associated protein Csb1
MNEQPKQIAAEDRVEPQVIEINRHLDALLGMEARKPGAAAELPAVIRITEKLDPAGGEKFPVFPPSYAGDGVNAPPVYDLNGIEYGEILWEKTSKDGAKRITRYIKHARQCTMDSPQSQANRTEIAFLDDEELLCLVPQAVAKIPRKLEYSDQSEVNVLALPHRVADFRVRASNQGESAKEAIQAFARGDALQLLRLMPTSILFGFWDSRAEGHQHKRARILLSRIDAFNVIPCEKHSVYTGPYSKDECAAVVLEDKDLADKLAVPESRTSDKDEDGKQKAGEETKKWEEAMARRGFSSAPGSGLGGVIAEKIERLALISLTDIASIFCRKPAAAEKDGKKEAEREATSANGKPDIELTNAARRYLLALALLAENYPRSMGSYRLRSGCELLPSGKETKLLGKGFDSEHAKELVNLCGNRKMLIKVAKAAHDSLGIPNELSVFDSTKEALKADLEKAVKKAAKQDKGRGSKGSKSKGTPDATTASDSEQENSTASE